MARRRLEHREEDNAYKREYMRKWYADHPDGLRRRDLRIKYGLTLEDFNEMLEIQGGCCAACCRVSDKWTVDHDHSCCPGQKTCGKCVRSILCSTCNTALGMAGDSSLRLRLLAHYIDSWREL